MKRILYTLSAILALSLSACSESDPVYNDLPTKISSFVSEYYPNQRVDSYQVIMSGYEVVIDNGPTIDFDKQYAWTSINGNGSTLPQQMLYDQLPPKLYSYLEQTAQESSVFAITRDKAEYTAKLLNSMLYYTISTGEISSRLTTAM